MAKHSDNHCIYCEGQGFYDVIVGGSETCPACEGTGIDEKE